jgi:hypothetical protein
VRVLDGIDFTASAAVKSMPTKKRPANRTIKLVAYRLAWWADADGRNVCPSVARIAVVCELDYTTVKACLRVLREVGLLVRVTRGGGRAGRGSDATLYRLTVPADLLEIVAHRSPDDIRDLMRVAAPPSCRRSSTEGMPPHADGGAQSSTEGMPHPALGVSVDDKQGSTEGMPPHADRARRGCPPEHGGDAPPIPTQLPPQSSNHHPATPPLVSTSPAASTADRETRSPDRPGGAPATRTTPAVQTAIWPRAVPDSSPTAADLAQPAAGGGLRSSPERWRDMIAAARAGVPADGPPERTRDTARASPHGTRTA